MLWLILLALVVVVIVWLAIIDLFQTKQAIRRNYPVIGRLRYILERIGPELRQYIVTDNDQERPFSRDQRRWVYATAKKENQYFGFGTDNKMDLPQYLLIRHAPFPHMAVNDDETHPLPVAKVMGEWRGRTAAFRPQSVVAISAMSFGSLSGAAIEALNKGAALSGSLHNTGEGGISDHHRHGGDLIFQLGTGYFGARSPEGRLDLDRLVEQVATSPVRAIEIKLSQGAKPGLGGVLPAAKVTAEIAAARGVPQGVTVASPARHAEFDSMEAMLAFIERVADATGVPVGIKSAVGQRRFWSELADAMAETGTGPDFIAIDGGEGGTGAAPLVFADNVALPFRLAFAEVYRTFAERHMHEKVVWAGAGKLGFPGEALLAMSLGVDMIYVGREAMLAVGCIQAQKCHTGHCPTGVATQQKWFVRGLDPTDKSLRTANYLIGVRHGLLQLANACGHAHPAQVEGTAIDLLLDGSRTESAWDHFGYDQGWRVDGAARLDGLDALMASR
ncbi:MAG: FMN-binding glutamate synthase family protein [Actinomycetota bacterium]